MKGIECQSLTEVFNKALGEVYETKATQEMFEQKVEVSVEAENTVSESWSGSGSVSARTQTRTRPCPRALSLTLVRCHVMIVCAVGQQLVVLGDG